MTENKHLDEHLSRYSLIRDDLTKVGDYDGPTILGKSGAGANVKPVKVLKTSCLDELKSWVGVPDEHYDSGDVEHHLSVPSAEPASLAAKDVNGLTAEQRETLVEGATAYVWGHSKKAAHWKSQVENFFAPFSVPVFALDNITVTAEHPWIIEGTPPQVINVGTITVEPGGEIIVKTSATINGETLNQASS